MGATNSFLKATRELQTAFLMPHRTLKVPKHEIFDGDFFAYIKPNYSRPENTDLEQFPFISKIRQDI
jgi:hypothetical protein